MRMLSDDTLAGGGIGVDQGSAAAAPAPAPATAPPQLVTPTTVAASQDQLTPEGSLSSATSSVNAHDGLILAALLCTFVGLLSCHYCGRGGRCRGRAQLAAGLKKSALRRIPVAVYEAAAAEVDGSSPAAGAAECAICLGQFEDGDAVRLLPRCRHGFHVPCIDTWLSAHTSCPICRDSLVDEAGDGATAADEEIEAVWMMSHSFTAGMLV